MQPTPRPSQEPKTLAEMPTTRKKKPRPKTKEVSSRYLSTPSTVTRSSHSPFPPHPSSINTTPRPDRFADENVVVFGHSETLSRRKMKLFADNAVAGQTPVTSMDRKMEVLGLFRENPLHTKDDISLSAAATRSVDWGRERNGVSLCRSSMRSDSNRHSFDANKEGSMSFPPLRPPNGKAGVEVRKERKGSKREEDAHLLRMSECRYLQWRFANARARAVDCARRTAAEKSVYSVSCKLRDLRDSVVVKRIELEQLRRMKSLSTIIQAQMPYLDKWMSLEEEHTSSLSGATNALHNASSQIPISESVEADTSELKEVINSAVNILNAVSPSVDKFSPKAEAIESVASELAQVVSAEKAMIEACGNLLPLAHELQVKECSLRSQLIQVRQSSAK